MLIYVTYSQYVDFEHSAFARFSQDVPEGKVGICVDPGMLTLHFV